MVKGIYRTPIHSMPLEDVKRFVGPDNLKAKLKDKGVKEGAKIFGSHVATSLIVKFDRIMHKIFTREWVDNNEIRSALKKEVRVVLKQDLSPLDLKDVAQFNRRLETRAWIMTSVSQIRQVCNTMIKEGVKEEDVVEILGILEEIEKVNENGIEKELKMLHKQERVKNKGKEKEEVKGKGKEKEEVKGKGKEKEEVKGKGKEKEKEIEYKEAGQGQKTLWKAEAGKLKELKEIKSKDNSQISEEDRIKLSAKVTELIDAAKDVEHKGEPLVQASLGATWGTWSKENKALRRIKEEALTKFSKQQSKPQLIRSEVIDVMSLIHKAFTQDVKFMGDDPMRGGDWIPAQGVPKNIQEIMDELKALI